MDSLFHSTQKKTKLGLKIEYAKVIKRFFPKVPPPVSKNIIVKTPQHPAVNANRALYEHNRNNTNNRSKELNNKKPEMPVKDNRQENITNDPVKTSLPTNPNSVNNEKFDSLVSKTSDNTPAGSLLNDPITAFKNLFTVKDHNNSSSKENTSDKAALKSTLNDLVNMLSQNELSSEKLKNCLEVLKNNNQEISVETQTVLTKFIIPYLEKNILKNIENIQLYLRDKAEFDRFCSTNSADTPYNTAMKTCLQKNSVSQCYTPQNYKDQIDYLKSVLTVIKDYPNCPEKDFMELLRRSGILKNPEAFYPKDNSNNENIIVFEGEGAKILSKNFKTILKLLKDQNNSNPANHGLMSEILNNIQKDDIKLTITTRTPNDALVLSGYDLHVIGIVNDPKDPDSSLIIFMLTSADDPDAVILSDKQYDLGTNNSLPTAEDNYNIKNNRPYEGSDSKPQRLRVLKTLVRVKNSDLDARPFATQYVHVHEDSPGNSVFSRILDSLSDNLLLLDSSPIQDISSFDLTRDILSQIAIESLTSAIVDLHKNELSLDNKLKSLTQSERDDYIEQLELHEQDAINNKKDSVYNSSLSKELRDLIEIKTYIEKLFKEKAKKIAYMQHQEFHKQRKEEAEIKRQNDANKPKPEPKSKMDVLKEKLANKRSNINNSNKNDN